MSRAVLFSATIYTLFGLASIFTLGRLLSRWRRFTRTSYALDDWASFLNYACVVALTVANYYQLANGLGQDAHTLDKQNIERFLLVSRAEQPYNLCLQAEKTTVDLCI